MTIVFAFTSCNRTLIIEKQSDYHDSIYDLESCLLETFGDYYIIEDPDIDSENKRIIIRFVFLTSYINSDNKDLSLLEVMEGTRILFNNFLADNPDYYLNEGYWIRISFCEAPDINDLQTPYEVWGSISNNINGTYSTETTLCNVNYHFLLSDLSNNTLSFEGIREINVEGITDTDFVLELLERMPDIEIVKVSSDDLETYYSEIRPDLQFI